MARMTAPNGAVVDVADDKVAAMVARGFTAETKAPAKKSTTRKSSK